MNVLQMMGMMNNPNGFSQQVMQQAMQQLTAKNPAVWNATMQKYGNMTKEQILQDIAPTYQKQGTSVQQVAAQLGITL